MNEINRKGRFPVLFVENRRRGFCGGLRAGIVNFPQNKVESLTLRKGPRKFKDKGDYWLLPMLEMVRRPV